MAKRRKIIAGNWKMNKTAPEARAYTAAFQKALGEAPGVEVVVCAPYPLLPVLKQELVASAIQLGAQNMFWAVEGAYTGEVSAAMLLETGCTYVILGHSERRELLQETDEMIARKIKAALTAGLTPILCVGENLAQREENKALDVVRGQIQQDLSGLSAAEIARIVVAYEPIWAIGTGRTASSEDAQEMCAGIRSVVAALSGPAAAVLPILYGGSVKAENIAELMRREDIDGALVGGASLDPQGFAALVQQAR
ncbi:MAG: triose-phosphate isomerase [Peptococcaceae bacterium]|jgi:triosephosphate isomerase|nr:triose-phosphate isomerase [Peptococcaceae bacterium]